MALLGDAYMAGWFDGTRRKTYSDKWFKLGLAATATREAYLEGYWDGYRARRCADRMKKAYNRREKA